MKSQEMIRKFKGTDASMVEYARVVHALMEEDLKAFTAFDATITSSFAKTFLQTIEAAETVVADSAVRDQQVQKTENLDAIMEQAKDKYADVKYFVQKTFPNSPGAQAEFGLNEYRKARQIPAKMIQFLDELHKTCVKHQELLIENGMSVVAITEIDGLKTSLINLNTAQKVFKKQRPILTEDRIEILNQCYQLVTQINAVAQRVYRNDYAKRNQFVFIHTPESGGHSYQGTVAPQTIKQIETLPLAPSDEITLHNTGNTELIFCLSTSSELEGNTIALPSGASTIKTIADLNPNATHLLVKNTDTTQTGSYEVDIE